MTHPDRAVEAFCDQIDKAVGIAGLDLQLGVTLRQRRQNRCKMGRAKGQRSGYTQPPAKSAGRQYGLSGNVDLGADPCGMIAKNCASFR